MKYGFNHANMYYIWNGDSFTNDITWIQMIFTMGIHGIESDVRPKRSQIPMTHGIVPCEAQIRPRAFPAARIRKRRPSATASKNARRPRRCRTCWRTTNELLCIYIYIIIFVYVYYILCIIYIYIIKYVYNICIYSIDCCWVFYVCLYIYIESIDASSFWCVDIL